LASPVRTDSVSLAKMETAFADLWWLVTAAEVLVVLLAAVFAFDLFGDARTFDRDLFLLLFTAFVMLAGLRALSRFCQGAMQRLQQLSELA
jgi:hypothetical protein